ncbi:cellulose biosynthesis protein BcsS [Sphingobium sp. RAC03]|uniref:cellulose biosynthesis protein BcsS n=1 Tax=Sphingobium sp. RAC03 TaxID=1843368 RepID=UPI00085632F0|nr:cellulose biosynthesis protein BcsS [Sphingobium sp. RAC03]AOF94730.1 hypothetical protein BSY17_3413 [Sphingobium sp. RAC03]
MTIRPILYGMTLLFSIGVAQAEDRGVIYAGGGAGDGAGGYAGGLVALPGASLGHGVAVRAGVNGGTYRYRASERIEATYLGAEIALVYQFSGDWGWANVSAGPRVTDTDLDPDDPGNKLRGTRLDAGLQSDGSLGNHWRLGWFGSWGVRNESYIAQLRLTRLLDEGSQTRVGLEGILQGDPTYKRGSLGGHVSTALGSNWQGQVSIGASEQAGRKAKPYASLGISRVF